MDREQTNFFSEESTIDINRSTWEDEFEHITTFNTGDLVPFYATSDILPGMTIDNSTAVLIRTMTPKYPTMGTLECDTYYFKVPWWTVWDNAKAFFGENEDGAWTNTTEYLIPKIEIPPETPVTHDSILSYMGIPQGYFSNSINEPLGIKVAALNVRAYYRIYNFWFRNQNLIAPIKYSTGDEQTLYNNENGGGRVLKVAKYYDYFRAALPEPQKGAAVKTPLGVSAPVSIKGNAQQIYMGAAGKSSPLKQASDSGMQTQHKFIWNGDNSFTGNLYFSSDPNKTGLSGTADLTNVTAATISALRLAFATQRILEKDARFGTRYNEIIRGHFGVNSPNASLHVPEYLGGSHFVIQMDQVLQTSSTRDEISPLGETGAYSQTFNINHDFVKSFDEHSCLIGLICIRQRHVYQQGIARQWTRARRLDLYWPSLAHLSNQPIYNYEIYAQPGGVEQNNEVFGYKEAWAEYKYTPDRTSGMVSSVYHENASLDEWTYADLYDNLPTLSKAWNDETADFVDRTLVVQSSVADQFLVDIAVRQKVTAPMPIHCTPGLIDHF